MKFLTYRDSERQSTPGLLRDGLVYSLCTAALPDLEAVLRAGSVEIDNIGTLRNPIM